MEEKNVNNDKDKFKDKMEDLGEKAQEFGKEAQSFAGKTLEGVEKLFGDVFKKSDDKEAGEEEVPTDPKDIAIAELKKEMDELRDKYVRLYADFDNYRKRSSNEIKDVIKLASKDIIKELLPVIDDFERAKKALVNSTDVNAAKEGMDLIYNKLVANLSSKGLKAIESVGKDFDVSLHEAITEIPAPSPDLQGKVIDETEKGYTLNDKIIRFAKVVVGKKD